MTLEDYAEGAQQMGAEAERNYRAMIHFCIALDIDWMRESYAECQEKLDASMDLLNTEMNNADDEHEAHRILVTRLGRLRDTAPNRAEGR